MNRRELLLGLGTCLIPGIAMGYPARPYAPETWPEIRDSYDKIVLNWRASWSYTCQIKDELITKALVENAAYEALVFVDVDWDTFGLSEWAKRLKIERRSTLIAMRGDEEIARLVNEPYEHRVRSFLDAALSA